jgi:hypothetical protein
MVIAIWVVMEMSVLRIAGDLVRIGLLEPGPPVSTVG